MFEIAVLGFVRGLSNKTIKLRQKLAQAGTQEIRFLSSFSRSRLGGVMFSVLGITLKVREFKRGRGDGLKAR
jgi:hypothetical protein